jgi:quinol monooxygenase YgiN
MSIVAINRPLPQSPALEYRFSFRTAKLSLEVLHLLAAAGMFCCTTRVEADASSSCVNRARLNEGQIMEQSNGPVLVLVEAHAKPGMRDAVIMGFKRSQALAPQWDGCRQFEIAVPADRDDWVVVVERWDSAEQHKRLFSQITSTEGFAQFRDLLTEDVSPRYLELR